eukprot:g9436.t1
MIAEDPTCYTIGILGDLHLDPRNMEDSLQGQLHMKHALAEKPNAFLVSLGDLGESLKCDDTWHVILPEVQRRM